MANEKTILQSNGVVIAKEALASGIVSPGNMLELESAGTVKRNSVTGGGIANYIAVEDTGQGKSYSDNYAVGDVVSYRVLRAGDRFLGKVSGAIAIGDVLESNNVGVAVAATGDAQFMALEANASGTGNIELEVI